MKKNLYELIDLKKSDLEKLKEKRVFSDYHGNQLLC